MTDTSRAPDRIWVDFYPRDWPTERIIYGTMPEPYVEYIREDISLAREAAAYEAAAGIAEIYAGDNGLSPAEGWSCSYSEAWNTGGIDHALAIQSAILALTPADAQAALDRLIREAEERGARRERELQRQWETGDE